MAKIKKDGGFVSFPVQLQRTNPIPIDSTLTWYSFEELQAYARSNGAAYVGQILSLIDETNKTATAYIVLNEAGDIQKINSVLTDNSSINKENEILSLKNFGKQYYKFIPGTDKEDSKYELQVVNQDNPWKSGLEPRTVFENDSIVLGWYEPNTTTIVGMNSKITTLQQDVKILESSLNKLDDSCEELKAQISDFDKILNGFIETESNIVTPGLITIVTNLSTQLNTEFLNQNQIASQYVSKEDFKTVVGDIEILLNKQVNLYDEIENIHERLTWQKI